MTPNRAQVQQYNANAVNYICLVMVAKPNATKTLPGAARPAPFRLKGLHLLAEDRARECSVLRDWHTEIELCSEKNCRGNCLRKHFATLRNSGSRNHELMRRHI